MIIQRFLYHLLRTVFTRGLLLLCLAGSVQVQAQNILVLGDSISAAYGMSLEQGWVALMAEQLTREYPDSEVVNASISGETTAGGLRRLPTLLEEHQPDLVIIELGGNDGLRGYPIANLRSNLDQLASLSGDAGARVVMLPMEIPPNYGSRYTTGFRQSFVQVAESTDSTLGPFLLDKVAINPALMQADGLHPTVEAQPILLDNVLPTILQTLESL